MERSWKSRGLLVKRISAYCQELNLIRILWRKIKYDWLPFDAYKTLEGLVEQVQILILNVGKEFVFNFE